MITVEETLKQIIETKAKELREKKIRPSAFLKLIKNILEDLKTQNYTPLQINEIVNNMFNVSINYNTFYRWYKRNIDNKTLANASKEEKFTDVKLIKKEKKNEVKKDDDDIWADEKEDVMMQNITVKTDKDIKKYI